MIFKWCYDIYLKDINKENDMAKLICGQNDLETWCKKNGREELLKEWDYDSNEGMINKFGADISKPKFVMPNSSFKVGWICNKGHHYIASIGNRTALNRGCPYCSNRLILKGFNDLATWCHDNNREYILKEWNYGKNDTIPEKMSHANSKKIWWKCELGHEWEATIASRTTGRPSGCPYCSVPPKKILVGFNDLETWCKKNKRENLLSEWDYEKNDILPCEVTFGSGKYIWWKCNKNHEWKTQIHNRTEGSKTNCPICSRTQTSFPEQTISYYLMQKYDILQRYHVKGREVDVFLPKYNIAIEYDGLMWHSGKKKMVQDLKKTKVLLQEGIKLIRIREAIENNIVKEEGQNVIEFVAKNGKYITAEFEWAIFEMYKLINAITGQKEIPDIDMQRDQFLIRAHYMNVLRENSVAAVFPELIKEWDLIKNEGVTPDSFSSKNNKKVWWKCSKGHSWLASINTRGVRKLGCPYCAGQRVISGDNDLETWCKENNMELLKEWNYDKNKKKPYEIPKSYKEKVFWKCAKGHEWAATVYNRVNGTGCPICNTGNNIKRNKISLEEWCLSNNSKLCEEWNYKKNDKVTPRTVTYGSHIKVWWKCSKGHEWQAQIKSRLYNHGCPYCSSTNKRAIPGVNDLETWCRNNDKEYILKEWDYEKNGELYPVNVTRGSHKKIWWKCSQGHRWEAVIKDRTKLHGNKCPICRKGNAELDV